MIPRCRCCNRVLGPIEAVAKFKFIGGKRMEITDEFIEGLPMEDRAYWRKTAKKMKQDHGYVGLCTTCSGNIGMVDFDQDPRNHEQPEEGALSFYGTKSESKGEQ